MRSHEKSWLTALSVVLALVCVNEEKAVAQGTAEGKQGVELTQSTNQELAALLKRLEEGRSAGDVERDASGNVISVTLRWTNANNRALFLVSTLDSLQQLMIQGRGGPESNEWTREGICTLVN